MRCHQFQFPTTRRSMLQNSAAGFGSLALAALAGQNVVAGDQQLSSLPSPLPHHVLLSPRPPHVLPSPLPPHVLPSLLPPHVLPSLLPPPVLPPQELPSSADKL